MAPGENQIHKNGCKEVVDSLGILRTTVVTSQEGFFF